MSQPIGPSILTPAELFQSWPQLIQPASPLPKQTVNVDSLVKELSEPSVLNHVQASGLSKTAASVSFVAPKSQVPRLNLPVRSASAKTGSEFWQSVTSMDRFRREKAIQQEIFSGNVPDHLRDFKPIQLEAQDSSGQKLTGTAYVTPDYLAIGSNEDYVLVPMSPITAQAIADQTKTLLPTRKLVDTIYKQAEVRLTPQPQKPGSQMMSTPYYQRHDQTIQKQRSAAHVTPGQLIAGHKKDVVITNRLDHKPKSVAIYGWHQPNGKNIQPLSTIHVNNYADYSHGVRLMSSEIQINGKRYASADILKDPRFSALLSDEGPILNSRAIRP